MSRAKILICPFCAEVQPLAEHCRKCSARLDPLGRRAEQNEMGPWWIHAEDRAFAPGCSYEAIVRLVEDGTIAKNTVLRGPTTRQLWTVARRVPGVAHLLGYCHACDAHVPATAVRCPRCRAAFGAWLDRQHLNLAEIEPLPGEAPVLDFGARGSVPVVLEPTGISAFASDEELRVAAGVASGSSIVASPPPPRAAAEPSPEQVLAHPVVRALRGRIAGEVRLRWMLVTIMLVLSVIAAFSVREAHRRGVETGRVEAAADAQRAADRAAASPAPSLPVPAPAPVAAPAGAAAPTPGASPSAPGEGTVGSAAGEAGAAEPPATGAGEPGAVQRETLQRAENFLAAARDATLSFDDRIAACDEALALLDALADLPPDAATFAAGRRAEITALRERLELERFFDPPG